MEQKNNMKVFLFGSNNVTAIPQVILTHIQNIIKENDGNGVNTEFIIGDTTGFDIAMHKGLSSIGEASKGTIYAAKVVRNNRFGLSEKIISEEELGEEEPRDYKRKLLANECDFAICYQIGESKSIDELIRILNIRNKYIFFYKGE